MKRTYILYGLCILWVIEIIFFGGSKYATDFSTLLEDQKQLFEIVVLLIGLMSGKLIIEAIDFVQESRVKTLKETFNLIVEYDKQIDVLIDSIKSLDQTSDAANKNDPWKWLIGSLGVVKILLFIDIIEQIAQRHSNNDLFRVYIDHIHFKIYLSLWTKKYLELNKASGKVDFKQVVRNRLTASGGNEELIDRFVVICRKYRPARA